MSYLDTEDEDDEGRYRCPVCDYDPDDWEVQHLRHCPQCRVIRQSAPPGATHFTKTFFLCNYFKQVDGVWYYAIVGQDWKAAGQVTLPKLTPLPA